MFLLQQPGAVFTWGRDSPKEQVQGKGASSLGQGQHRLPCAVGRLQPEFQHCTDRSGLSSQKNSSFENYNMYNTKKKASWKQNYVRTLVTWFQLLQHYSFDSQVGVIISRYLHVTQGFPATTGVKNLPAIAGNTRDMGSIPGLGRSLKQKMAIYSSILTWKSHEQRSLMGYSPYGVAKSQTQLSTAPSPLHVTHDVNWQF